MTRPLGNVRRGRLRLEVTEGLLSCAAVRTSAFMEMEFGLEKRVHS